MNWNFLEFSLFKNTMKKLNKSFKKNILDILKFNNKKNKQGTFVAGHYYSPIPDKNEILEYYKSKESLKLELPDVKLYKNKQYELLNDYLKYYKELPFPLNKNSDFRYYFNNGWFSSSDAIFLYTFLRKHTPERIIEIGSGFSSAIILDTVDNFYSYRPDITFIEPYPNRLIRLLKNDDAYHVNIIDKKVQDVPVDNFLSFEEGDFLFIDSSHVLKCGSDLQRLLFEILPLLPKGIFVHFHDVQYPFDYPFEWFNKGRFWNESYFLRAFLSYNCDWEVYFFNTFVEVAFNRFIKENMPLCLKNSGGSLYLKRVRKG